MRRETVILSIGLNTGKVELPGALARAIKETIRAGFIPEACGMTTGEWEGIRERTLHLAIGRQSFHENASFAAFARLAKCLAQDCVAVLGPDAGAWTLAYADGVIERGGDVADFPVAIPAEVL
jgi:hypothetical protein